MARLYSTEFSIFLFLLLTILEQYITYIDNILGISAALLQ